MSIQKRRNSLLKSSISIDSIRKSVGKFRDGIVKSNSTASDIVKTTNKNKVDAFKVSFSVLENEMATPGKKRVSIKILDSQNNVVVVKNGTKNNLIVDYKNESLGVTSYIEVDRKNVKPGGYKVIVSVEGLSAGQKTINLG